MAEPGQPCRYGRPMRGGVGLHMIVKDEAPVIERCLRSVLPVIDWWVICDTGSTDGTQTIIETVTAGTPGRLLQRPWVSFGHNRHEALEAARSLAGATPAYTLWLDADEVLEDPPDSWPAPDLDGYLLEVRRTGVRYERVGLVRLDRPWRWTGVVHEHLELPGGTTGRLDRPWVRSEREGARARDPETFRRDAEAIAAALAGDAANPRLEFYLAQSWYDAGEWRRALAAYRTRADNPGGWGAEAWFASSRIPHCLERLGAPTDEVVAAHLAAYQRDPGRAEPLVEASRLERERGITPSQRSTRRPRHGSPSRARMRSSSTWRPTAGGHTTSSPWPAIGVVAGRRVCARHGGRWRRTPRTSGCARTWTGSSRPRTDPPPRWAGCGSGRFTERPPPVASRAWSARRSPPPRGGGASGRPR